MDSSDSQLQPPPTDDAGHAAKAAAIGAAIAALVALRLYGTKAACSVLIGGAVGIANLLTMRLLIRKLVRESSADGEDAGGGGSAIAWGLLAAVKILVLVAGIWFLLTRRFVDPMPLVVGYMAMPFGIAASAVWSSLRSRH